jgi:predicted RecB family endonuclease
MNGLGVVAGVPDVIAVKAGRMYALELKTRTGKVSAAQNATMTAMDRAGAVVTVAYGLDDALTTLEAWGLLRGKAK